MDAVPNIKPIKTKQYDVPESRYKQAGKLPFRSIILGSSGSGKTILLQNMIIDIYKKMNEYIYMFTEYFSRLSNMVACQEIHKQRIKIRRNR